MTNCMNFVCNPGLPEGDMTRYVFYTSRYRVITGKRISRLPASQMTPLANEGK